MAALVDSAHLAPLLLTANQPVARPYRGGAGIPPVPRGRCVPRRARARGLPRLRDDGPRERGGRPDRPAVGPDAARRRGVRPGRVPRGRPRRALRRRPPAPGEAINPEQRLFVHYHPDDAFARARLSSALGKTEAWVVVEAPADGHAYVGFRRPVTADEVTRWYDQQDVEGMLPRCTGCPSAPGTRCWRQAGQPHAVSAGLTLLELQQPTDLSLILEQRRLPGARRDVGPDGASSWLPALEALALDGLSDRGAGCARAPGPPVGDAQLPGPADAFFRVERRVVDGTALLDPGFAVVVVVAGAGSARPTPRRRPPLSSRG